MVGRQKGAIELDTKEALIQHAEYLDNEIRGDKQTQIRALDSMMKTLAHEKTRLEKTLDNSTKTDGLNELGIMQSQGQMIELRCMEIVTKAKQLSMMRRIIAHSEVK